MLSDFLLNNCNVRCKMFSKVKALDIPEIKAKIVGGQYHFHEDRPVPDRSLQLWKKRGYNAHKVGIIHVRYEMDGKPTNKYIFPLYFWVDTK